jgi:uncharacterized repeat protein (TIGR01451 family)
VQAVVARVDGGHVFSHFRQTAAFRWVTTPFPGDVPMKRLVLRIAALGTVVVLGLIAIAQAQRGSEDMPPAANQLAPAGNEFSAQSPPVVPPAGSENRLRAAVSSGPGENPLRSEGPLPKQAENSPPEGKLVANHRGRAEAVSPVSAELPKRLPSADRFGSYADRSSTVTGPEPVRMVQPAGAAVATLPPEEPPSRFAVQGSPPARQFAVPPVRPLGEASAMATTPEVPLREGNAEIPTGPLGLAEPARFQADPYATPAGASAPELAMPENPRPLAPSARAGDVSPGLEGTGQPGSKQLEGPQSPQLTIQKSGPPAIQVGMAAEFRITVRNTGQVAAHEVEVRDQVPKGTRLISTNPRASRGASGELVWALGTIRPGAESSVEIQLEPIAEGEIGSVATVRFQADASARSVVTKPELVLKTSGPAQVLSGEKITLTIEVSNPGSGLASGVVIEEQVPAGLQHPGGPALEYEVGDLPPGESRKLDLTLAATRPGPVVNLLTAHAQGNLRAEDRLNLEVIAPLLEVAVAGPKRRYLEREAVYRLSVHNPGTAPAERVELVAYLPDGLKFVRANNSGNYEEADRTVHWRLEELPKGSVGAVELVAMPTEAGEQTIRLRGTAERGVSADGEQAVLVEGIAAIKFVMVDVTDPIEVGGETSYEIRVVNQGSKAATNVRLAVLLPPEMRAVAAEGPTRHALQSNRVVFEGLPRLAPKADTTYRVRAQGLKPGDLRICAQLLTDEMQTPVVKEESTRVYSDE